MTTKRKRQTVQASRPATPPAPRPNELPITHIDLSAEPESDMAGWLDLLMSQPTAVTVTITPALAELMLLRNVNNYRKLSPAKIADYKRQMLEGHWRLTGEAIIFTTDGHLGNGQHRLHACVQAGVSFITDVRTGMAPEATDVMDTGLKRRNSDVLRHHGETNVNHMAAALRHLWCWENGHYGFGTSIDPLTATELLAAHPGMRDSINTGQRVHSHLHKGAVSIFALSHYLLRQRSLSEMVDRFFYELDTGAGLSLGSPVLALRNRLIGADKLSIADMLAFIIKAWNAWSTGKPLQVLRMMPDETFPQIRPALAYPPSTITT